MVRTAGSLTLILWLTALSATAARADTDGLFPPNNVSVLDRPRPDYQAVGIQAGGFTIFPKASFEGAYDDNIFATTKPQGDYIWTLAPSLSVVSDWGRNALSFDAGLQRDIYSSHSILNDTAWNVDAAGRYDISSAFTLAASGGYYREIEPKTSPNTIPGSTAANISYDLAQGKLSGAYQLGRTRFVATVDASQWRFQPDKTENGPAVDESQRNHDEIGGSARFEYAFSPMTGVFLETTGAERRYDQTPGSIDRDSTGYSALVGLHFELTHLIDGEAAVGYLNWNYVDPAAKTFSGVDGRATVNWYATPIVTVVFNASRTVQDSGLPDVAGYVDSDASLRADYELLRNLIFSGQIEETGFDFIDIDRNDHRFSASLRASYLINHSLGVGLTYSHITNTSSGFDRGENFDDNRITVELILQR